MPSGCQLAYENPGIKKSWEAYKENAPAFLAISGVYVLVGLVELVISLLIYFVILSMTDAGENTINASRIISRVVTFPLSFVSQLSFAMITVIAAIYYQKGEKVTIKETFNHLFRKPLRYIVAGIFYTITLFIGILFCIIPGIIILFITPIYINRVFTTELGIIEAFGESFQSLFHSQNWISFCLISFSAGLLTSIITICTCFIGGLVAIPMCALYIQNLCYSKGILT